MQLESLVLLHVKKQNLIDHKNAYPSLNSKAFFVDTCQRKFWLTNTTFLQKIKNDVPKGFDIFIGLEAYNMLLKITAGLESQIQGETDVFGQIKCAWQEFELSSLRLMQELRPWIQKIFEDTKAIRTRYLQNFGGSSYGSLSRKILDPQKTDKILIIGAGQIIESIMPYLLDAQITIWNRTSYKAHILAAKYNGTQNDNIRVITNKQDIGAQIIKADNLIIGIPVNHIRDEKWISLFLSHNQTNNKILHLGCTKQQASWWTSSKSFLCLDDLFELQKQQDDIRRAKIKKARLACLEKAKLRSLGGSISLPHGWEDLAIFA